MILSIGLVFAKGASTRATSSCWRPAVYVLAALSAFTVLQRILYVAQAAQRAPSPQTRAGNRPVSSAPCPRRARPAAASAGPRRPRADPGGGARAALTARGSTPPGSRSCARAARVSKRTLYQHFASKDEVVRRLPGRELAADPAYPPNAVLTRAGPRAPGAAARALRHARRRSPPLRGCPFVNAGVELADPDSSRAVASPPPTRRSSPSAWRPWRARPALAAPSASDGGWRCSTTAPAARGRCCHDSPEPAAEAQALAAALLRRRRLRTLDSVQHR